MANNHEDDDVRAENNQDVFRLRKQELIIFISSYDPTADTSGNVASLKVKETKLQAEWNTLFRLGWRQRTIRREDFEHPDNAEAGVGIQQNFGAAAQQGDRIAVDPNGDVDGNPAQQRPAQQPGRQQRRQPQRQRDADNEEDSLIEGLLKRQEDMQKKIEKLERGGRRSHRSSSVIEAAVVVVAEAVVKVVRAKD